jgi:hypothetical protein
MPGEAPHEVFVRHATPRRFGADQHEPLVHLATNELWAAEQVAALTDIDDAEFVRPAVHVLKDMTVDRAVSVCG